MIKKDQIEYAAKLSRIKLTSEEKEKLQKDLSSILSYVKKLQEIDTEDVDLMSRSTKIKNVTRKDVAQESKDKNEIKNLFPEEKDGFLKVKSIL